MRKICNTDHVDEEEFDSYVAMDKELAKNQTLKERIKETLNSFASGDRKHVNQTDPDCAIMRSIQGSHAGYNVQSVADDKHGLIVHAEAVSDTSDVNQFSCQIEQANDLFEKPCDIACADAGYADTDELEKIDGKGITVIVPSQRQALHEEYLRFRDIRIDGDREEIFESEIKRCFRDYLESGGFIEALSLEGVMRRKYFKESLLERVIFVDVPQTFRLDRPELLFSLINVASAKPGLFLDVKNLSNNLKVDQRTLSNYLNYLEYSLFLQKLYNYSPNLLTSEKKMKRLYVSNTAFTWALNPQVDFSLLLEQFFVNTFGARFFLRTPQKEEIDIIKIRETAVLPVEIKIQDQITNRDANFLFKFLEKYNQDRALLITRDTETIFRKSHRVVDALPYWKYWSILKKV